MPLILPTARRRVKQSEAVVIVREWLTMSGMVPRFAGWFHPILLNVAVSCLPRHLPFAPTWPGWPGICPVNSPRRRGG